MSILVVLLSLAAGAYALAVIERWAVHGHLSLTGPAWAALALMGRESLLARKSDRLFFELGPVLLLVVGARRMRECASPRWRVFRRTTSARRLRLVAVC